DTFIYKAGYGALEIKEDASVFTNSAATVQFGPGLTASNMQVSSDASGNMYLADGTSGDRITLDGEMNLQFGYSEFGVGSVSFSDGSSLTRQQLITLADTGSATNTQLYG